MQGVNLILKFTHVASIVVQVSAAYVHAVCTTSVVAKLVIYKVAYRCVCVCVCVSPHCQPPCGGHSNTLLVGDVANGSNPDFVVWWRPGNSLASQQEGFTLCIHHALHEVDQVSDSGPCNCLCPTFTLLNFNSLLK